MACNRLLLTPSACTIVGDRTWHHVHAGKRLSPFPSRHRPIHISAACHEPQKNSQCTLEQHQTGAADQEPCAPCENRPPVKLHDPKLRVKAAPDPWQSCCTWLLALLSWDSPMPATQSKLSAVTSETLACCMRSCGLEEHCRQATQTNLPEDSGCRLHQSLCHQMRRPALAMLPP